MTRTLSKILILVLMVGIFFAPVGASFEKKDNQIAFNVEVSKVEAQAKTNDWTASKFSCGFFENAGLTGCFSWFAYYFLYTPISFFASLAAQFLDYFIYYSTNSTSYSSNFVGVAWGAVRDIANIFFIIGLLYVAIETILGIGHNGKKMIASIIVVALLINFSLFFTQVVIDTSNILARVFYNNIDAINKDKSLAIGSSGEKSITTALVSMFDPQDIVSPTQYASNDYDGGPGAFITITLLATVVSAIMLWVFLATALMFVARVAGLYISMIFAPIAFASYTVPFDIEGLGHKQWWTTLLKQAFLAPIFIFFLYVILLFRDAFKTIFGDVKISTDSVSWSEGHINGLLKVIIPFAIVTVLLLRAKKLAVEYSGTIGESFSKAGNFIAGAATGGVIGAYATVGRATLGRAGNLIGNSETVKKLATSKTFGWAGRGIMDAGKFVGKSTFDVRGTGLVSEVGKEKVGGYAGTKERQVNKRLKRAKELEAGEDSDLKQDLNKKQLALKEIKENQTIQKAIKDATKGVEDATKEVAEFERKLKDTMDRFGKNSPQANASRVARDNRLTLLETAKAKLKAEEKPIKDAEEAEHKSQHNLDHENNRRRGKYATNNESNINQVITVITGGSMSSNRQASHNIRMGLKPTDDGSHGGGSSHGGGAHATTAPKGKKASSSASGGGHGGGSHGGGAHHP